MRGRCAPPGARVAANATTDATKSPARAEGPGAPDEAREATVARGAQFHCVLEDAHQGGLVLRDGMR